MKEDNKKWEIHLYSCQRLFHAIPNVVLLLITLAVDAYLIVLIFMAPDYYLLYLFSILCVWFFQRAIFKKEIYEPNSPQEKLILKIENGEIHYGVPGRELKIDYPVSVEKGLFGCINLKFGPIYYLPIPKIIALEASPGTRGGISYKRMHQYENLTVEN
jgi:hypothetical protein